MCTDLPEAETGPVYSRDFRGSPRSYLLISVASALYLGLGIPVLYGIIRYYFVGDATAFSIDTVLYIGIFCALYIPWSYRVMMKYDGMLSSGGRWIEKEVRVKLIETRKHHRFG